MGEKEQMESQVRGPRGGAFASKSLCDTPGILKGGDAMSGTRSTKKTTSTTRMTRRECLQTAAAAGAAVLAPTIVPASALGRGGAVAPSERIVLGAIGIGARGEFDLGLQPIMPLDLPVKVRSWELTVYPRSYIRRWPGVTRPAQART